MRGSPRIVIIRGVQALDPKELRQAALYAL